MLMLCLPMVSLGQSSQEIVVQQQDSILLQQVDTVQRQSKVQKAKERFKKRIDDKLNEPYDTTRNSG